MRVQMVEAWKDARLPEKQISLNRSELAGKYPPHWQALLQCLRRDEVPKNVPFYDVGCGVGATYALLRQEKAPFQYCGIDFSEAMISTAREAWGSPEVFHIDDYRTWTRNVSDGILYCTGLLDIVEDGTKELRRLLSFGSPTVLLNRVNISANEKLQTYMAYDTIPCYSYTFAYMDFLNTVRTAGYSIVFQSGSCYLLRKIMP